MIKRKIIVNRSFQYIRLIKNFKRIFIIRIHAFYEYVISIYGVAAINTAPVNTERWGFCVFKNSINF